MLKAGKGVVRAKHVILATNAYGGLFAESPWQAHTQELTILPYFQFATNPLPDAVASRILPERQGTWDTGLVMTSFRMDQQNRLIFGSIGRLDAMAEGTHRAFAARSVRKLFPYIGDFRFEYWWDGRIGMTTNNLPAMHTLAPNVVSVSGYNGRGIAPGTVFGRALAHHVTGESVDPACGNAGHAGHLAHGEVGLLPRRRPGQAFHRSALLSAPRECSGPAAPVRHLGFSSVTF